MKKKKRLVKKEWEFAKKLDKNHCFLLSVDKKKKQFYETVQKFLKQFPLWELKVLFEDESGLIEMLYNLRFVKSTLYTQTFYLLEKNKPISAEYKNILYGYSKGLLHGFKIAEQGVKDYANGKNTTFAKQIEKILDSLNFVDSETHEKEKRKNAKTVYKRLPNETFEEFRERIGLSQLLLNEENINEKEK